MDAGVAGDCGMVGGEVWGVKIYLDVTKKPGLRPGFLHDEGGPI